jgi:3-deoxy-D-manno-octulosonate 8-phosphate phosphatase (KDO 8-P phosphatase)
MQASARIRLLVLDVDGTLTDGSIVLGPDGQEWKRFCVRDGLGIAMWKRAGGLVAIITGRRSEALTHRARELGIDHVHQSASDKAQALGTVLAATGCAAHETVAIGDDLPDLALFRRVAFGMAPADAAPEVRAAARHVMRSPGGHGAVREAIEVLLRGDGRWDSLVAAH